MDSFALYSSEDEWDLNENRKSLITVSNLNESFEMRVFHGDQPYKNDEHVEVILKDENEKPMLTETGQNLFYRLTYQIGRNQNFRMSIQDPYASFYHCKLDFSFWFRKQRPLFRQYTEIIKSKSLPFSLWRHIFSFLREPRYILLTDYGSENGTLISLKPNRLLDLSNRKFRLGEYLSLDIKAETTIKLASDESNATIEDKITEKLFKNKDPQKTSLILYDLFRSGEQESKVFHILSFKVRLLHRSKIDCKYYLVTNKPHSSFVLGNSFESDIQIGFDKIDEFQCEFVFNDGRWSIREWEHTDKKKRTWLDIAKEKDLRYKIVEETEILIGKTYINVSFPIINDLPDKPVIGS